MGFEGCSRPVVAVHTLGKRALPMRMLLVADELNNRRHQVVEAGRRLWQLRKEKKWSIPFVFIPLS